MLKFLPILVASISIDVYIFISLYHLSLRCVWCHQHENMVPIFSYCFFLGSHCWCFLHLNDTENRREYLLGVGGIFLHVSEMGLQ